MDEMNVLSFIASLVASLAWPTSLLVVVLLFRAHLKFLFEKIARLQYGGLDVTFRAEVEGIKQVMIEAAAQPALPEATQPPSTGPSFDKAVAHLPPRAALLEAWFPFEVTASRIGTSLGIGKPGRPPQMQELIDGLRKEGILNDAQRHALTMLRDLRNKAVHPPGLDIAPDTLASYVDALRQITDAMEKRAAAKGLK